MVREVNAASKTGRPNFFQNLKKREWSKKRPTFTRNLKHYMREWSENTSLHGVRYLGERKRNISEKLWWLILFAVSLYLCVDLILRTYQKWDSSPVIVSFAQSPTPVREIPFPAVTICPEIKTRKSVYHFAHYFHKFARRNNITPEEVEEWKKFQDIALICGYDRFLNRTKQYGDANTLDGITEIAPEFNEIFHSCNWADKHENCDQLFTPVFTEEGVCYTFNMLNREDLLKNREDPLKNRSNPITRGKIDWTLEEGYGDETGKDTFPRRAMSAGTKAGLTLTMKANNFDIDYVCSGPVQGFKILLHHPGQTPVVSTQYFRAPLNQEIIVSVKPDMMKTSANLRDYAYHRRHCYFSRERPLTFHKDYTQKNCEVECRAKYTLNNCGCVAFHMPRNESTKICGPGSRGCMAKALREQISKEIQRGIHRSFKHSELDEDDCNCLPACTSLTYNVATSFGVFDWVDVFNAHKINTSDFPDEKFTRVTIFFQDMQFIPSQRSELYGPTDFFANCGGILGLFIGFSFLSIVETVYFLTFRLFCNVRRHGRYFWSGSPELINDDHHK